MEVPGTNTPVAALREPYTPAATGPHRQAEFNVDVKVLAALSKVWSWTMKSKSLNRQCLPWQTFLTSTPIQIHTTQPSLAIVFSGELNKAAFLTWTRNHLDYNSNTAHRYEKVKNPDSHWRPSLAPGRT